MFDRCGACDRRPRSWSPPPSSGDCEPYVDRAGDSSRCRDDLVRYGDLAGTDREDWQLNEIRDPYPPIQRPSNPARSTAFSLLNVIQPTPMPLCSDLRLATGHWSRTFSPATLCVTILHKLMATNERVSRYLADLAAKYRDDQYIPRLFRTAEEWDKWANQDWRSHRFGSEPDLEAILEQRRLVILGEPGSGKSTIASAAVRVGLARGWVPVLVSLRGYRGNLKTLIAETIPADVLADVVADQTTQVLFVLDGFDEVADEYIDHLLKDLAELEGEPNARMLLTSRQAFFVNRRHRFSTSIATYYLLEFSEDDINVFVDRRSPKRREFMEAANAAHLTRELSNPLVLDALVSLFEAKGVLGRTRSDAIEHVIDKTLASRPTSNPKRERQALRMLALTMEIAARNELLEAEAVRVLATAFRMPDDQAKQLLDELTQSILIRTSNGYTFQMRSFGEYLAASELADVRERDRLLEPLFLDRTREPHDSWRNAVSYLVEMNRGARSYFTWKHPDWLVTSSAGIFGEDERTELVLRLMDQLKERREYLTHHPLVRAFDLARFVTPAVSDHLRGALDSTDDVEVANAILLLGAARVVEVSERALELGLDPGRSLHIRHSALNALDWIGRPEMIPRLLDIADLDEATTVSRIDTAGALMDIAHTCVVLEYLAKTETTMSAAYYRFRELSTAEEFEAVLDALLRLDPGLSTSRLNIYLEPTWPAMVRAWHSRLIPKVVSLLLIAGDDDEHEFADKMAEALLKLNDRGAAIGHELVIELVRRKQEPKGFPRVVPQLVSVADAEWLCAQPNCDEIVSYFRAFGSSEVRQFLFSKLPARTSDERIGEELRKWETQRAAEERRMSALLQTLHQSHEPLQLLKALFQLQSDKWPDLSDDQRQVLRSAVEERLAGLGLSNRIVWQTDNSWQSPRELHGLLKVLEHYALRLADDRILVQALRAREVSVVARYHERFGLAAPAIADVEAMLAGTNLSTGALESVLEFVAKSGIHTAAMLSALQALLVGNRSDQLKLTVVAGLAQTSGGVAVLAANHNVLPDAVKRAAENHLLDAQHPPTIYRRLAQLESDPGLLASGNVERHFGHPLEWLGRITLPLAWNSLKRLRRTALQNSFEWPLRIITNTMAKIDQIRLSQVILEQVDVAPASWQPHQRTQAIQHERDGKIAAAQATPFERILERIRAFSTMERFKLWVEGPKDISAGEVLIKRVAGDAVDVVVQSIGGWAQVLSADWSPAPMSNGCSDVLVLLDGDRARDWTKSGNPIHPDTEMKEVIRKFRQFDIEYHILERYALENYFSQSAYEQVIGSGTAQYFPLDPSKSVESQIPGYQKRLNGDLATATDLSELAGTDLGRLLEGVRRRIAE